MRGWRASRPYKKCEVIGCKKDTKSRGMCSMHHARLLKYGDPLQSKYTTSGTCLECHEKVQGRRGAYCSEPCRLRFLRRKHRRENPEMHRVYAQNRRAFASNCAPLVIEEWLFVKDFYGEICLSCSKECRQTIDHIVPVSKGGDNSIRNLQPLCQSCNSTKRDKTIDYRPDGGILMYESWMVRCD